MQEEAEAYDLVGQVMLPRGYVSIQYESHENIQDALEALTTRDDGRRPSATTLQEIHRWTCRLGNYSHYMTPFWLSIRLSNIWELSNQAHSGAAVAHHTAIPQGQREAIAHIAKELQRIQTSTAWEHITFADLCFRAWHLFEARWQEILGEDQARQAGTRWWGGGLSWVVNLVLVFGVRFWDLCRRVGYRLEG